MSVQKISIDNVDIIRIVDLLEPKKFSFVSNFIEKQTFDSNGFMLDLNEDYSNIDIAYQVILNTIKEAFNSSLGLNVYPTGFCVSRNRGVDHWHTHVGEFKNDPKIIDPKKFHVALYYPHSNWDPQYGGNLLLGTTKETSTHSFPSMPNSCIIHNNLIGHDLDFLNLEQAISNRIVMYSHWLDK
jgi:hypothetical protein